MPTYACVFMWFLVSSFMICLPLLHRGRFQRVRNREAMPKGTGKAVPPDDYEDEPWSNDDSEDTGKCHRQDQENVKAQGTDNDAEV